jgi:hypothetical protein
LGETVKGRPVWLEKRQFLIVTLLKPRSLSKRIAAAIVKSPVKVALLLVKTLLKICTLEQSLIMSGEDSFAKV